VYDIYILTCATNSFGRFIERAFHLGVDVSAEREQGLLVRHSDAALGCLVHSPDAADLTSFH
jgi:hypothetical protein